MIEYTLLNILISELKIYCGPDEFYGWSKFGQYDEVNNRAPYMDMYRILKETFLAWKVGGGGVKNICYTDWNTNP